MRFPAHGFMKKPVLSTDSLGPDLHRSKEKNLRKSAKSVEKKSSLPNSKKSYVAGKVHPDRRVPFREISLAPTKTMSGEIEVNEPVRVYDTSGPWGDSEFRGNVEQGLPPLRAKWIRDRGDVEEIEGRAVRPQDNGFLSEKHAAERNGQKAEVRFQRSAKNKPLRAKSHAVTQLYYARQGIITPEMEYVAIRENGSREDRVRRREISLGNLGSARDSRPGSRPGGALASPNGSEIARNDLAQQHPGESFGASIPREITPEFVRSEVARGRAIIPANINHPESEP